MSHRTFADAPCASFLIAQRHPPIKNGARGIEPKGGELGPNSRYYGKKKDMTLLFNSHTPELADVNQVRRRAMLASMVKPAMKKIKNLGLLGVVGALMAKELLEQEDNNKAEPSS